MTDTSNPTGDPAGPNPTDPTDPTAETLGDGLDRDDLGGHSIDELSDYLDAGREPRDPSIENSPGARIALDALSRLRRESWAMLEVEARADTGRDRAWLTSILDGISHDAKAGRDIPLTHPDPSTHLNITEGSVRGLIRAAGDGTGGAIVGKVTLAGDVTLPGEAISVDVAVSVTLDENLLALAERIRQNILAALHRHTELNVVAVDVTIQNVHETPPTSGPGFLPAPAAAPAPAPAAAPVAAPASTPDREDLA
jgi:uncharacterized alkaline shock family protein YloU